MDVTQTRYLDPGCMIGAHACTRPKHRPIPAEEENGCPKDAVGMPGHRHRRDNGLLTRKRADTLLRTLRVESKLKWPDSIPRNTTLKVLREVTGCVGLHKVSVALNLLYGGEHHEVNSVPECEERKGRTGLD